MSQFVVPVFKSRDGPKIPSHTTPAAALEAGDMILPVLLQYIVICILLEYRFVNVMM